MTRKDFNAIARGLRASRPHWSPEAQERGRYSTEHNQWQKTCQSIAGAIATPTFDRERFLEACGYWDAGND